MRQHLRPTGPLSAEARPGHLLRASRSAITSRAGLGAVPGAHPPSPLCMRQHGRLLAAEGTEAEESQPRARGRESQAGHQHRPLVNKKPRLAPTLRCSSPRPCFSFPCPHQPGAPCPCSIPRLSVRRQAETCPFFSGAGRRLQKALYGGAGGTGSSIHFPFPRPAPRAQLAARSRRTISALQPRTFTLASICLHRRPALQHLALTMNGYSGSGALPRTTSMHSRYFNVLQIMWLIIL